MSMIYPLTLPSITGVREVTLRARSTVGVSESPYTAQQQVYVHQGEYFEADVLLPPMKGAAAAEWSSFLLSLNGREGTFLMGDPAYRGWRHAAGDGRRANR
jgi:hypothetical protein